MRSDFSLNNKIVVYSDIVRYKEYASKASSAVMFYILLVTYRIYLLHSRLCALYGRLRTG